MITRSLAPTYFVRPLDDGAALLCCSLDGFIVCSGVVDTAKVSENEWPAILSLCNALLLILVRSTSNGVTWQ